MEDMDETTSTVLINIEPDDAKIIRHLRSEVRELRAQLDRVNAEHEAKINALLAKTLGGGR